MYPSATILKSIVYVVNYTYPKTIWYYDINHLSRPYQSISISSFGGSSIYVAGYAPTKTVFVVFLTDAGATTDGFMATTSVAAISVRISGFVERSKR